MPEHGKMLRHVARPSTEISGGLRFLYSTLPPPPNPHILCVIPILPTGGLILTCREVKNLTEKEIVFEKHFFPS